MTRRQQRRIDSQAAIIEELLDAVTEMSEELTFHRAWRDGDTDQIRRDTETIASLEIAHGVARRALTEAVGMVVTVVTVCDEKREGWFLPQAFEQRAAVVDEARRFIGAHIASSVNADQ